MADPVEAEFITCPHCDGTLVVVLNSGGHEAQFACETCSISAKNILTLDGYVIRLVVEEKVH